MPLIKYQLKINYTETRTLTLTAGAQINTKKQLYESEASHLVHLVIDSWIQAI